MTENYLTASLEAKARRTAGSTADRGGSHIIDCLVGKFYGFGYSITKCVLDAHL